MRKNNGILNSELLAVIARLGHFQYIIITDAGTPIPPDAKLIDLAVFPGLPSLYAVTEAIVNEMSIEKITFTEETKEANPSLLRKLQKLGDSWPQDWITHEDLKARCEGAACIIRTGECSPYANLILTGSVPF